MAEGCKGAEEESRSSRSGAALRGKGPLALIGLLCLSLAGCATRIPADRPLQSGVLLWGGDQNGGEPYIIKDDQGGEPGGFEGDLARYLAGKLDLSSQFVNKEWSSLLSHLDVGDADVVLNGYEFMPERAQEMAFSLPYYAYRVQLIVHKDSSLRGWDDLRQGKPRVGVLMGTAAERYLRQNFPNVSVEALDDQGVTGVMKEVATRNMDATVQDLPAAVWYMDRRNEFPELKKVDKPIAPGPNSYYVLYLRRGDELLRDRINTAIREGLEDGSLKEIYQRYGVWDEDQQNLLQVVQDWPPPEVREQRGLWWFAQELLYAAGWTVLLACLSMPLAMLLGLLVALGRLYGPTWLALPLAAYVELIRGTPILIQLYLIYFGLPNLGIKLPSFVAGVIGLAVNYSAYEAENYRAGLLAIPRGQMEAALALGMSRWTALRRVIVPQALRLVVPSVTNDFISLFKDSSVCSIIGVVELAARYRGLRGDYLSMALYLGLMTALFYFLMSYPLSLLARRLEQRQQRVA